MTSKNLRDNYKDLFGFVPKAIEDRIALGELANRMDAVTAIEAWREELLHRNALDRKTQQLVHFALLIGAGLEVPARLHAKAALKAGATVRDLFGVAETAAVTGGMPAFSLAVAIIGEAVADYSTRCDRIHKGRLTDNS